MPVSSVARLDSTAGPPFHCHGARKRTGALGRIGPDSAAGAQLLPPSAETSTCLMLPLPDQASPEISKKPGPVNVSPGDGRVIRDFTSIGNTNCQAFSSLSKI